MHTIQLVFSPGALAPAPTPYTGNLRITVTGRPDAINIPISLTVFAGFTVAPTAINLSGGQTSQPVSIIPSNTSQAYSYTTAAFTASGGSWLSAIPSVSPTSAAGTQSFNVIANPTGLTTGVTYTGTVRVFISSQSYDIAVNFTPVAPPNAISGYTITPTIINFAANYTQQIVDITPQNLSTPYFYTTSSITQSGQQWLSVSPATSPSPVTGAQSLTVSANPTGLTTGVTYVGTVRVFINTQYQDIAVTFIPGASTGIPGYTSAQHWSI